MEASPRFPSSPFSCLSSRADTVAGAARQITFNAALHHTLYSPTQQQELPPLTRPPSSPRAPPPNPPQRRGATPPPRHSPESPRRRGRHPPVILLNTPVILAVRPESTPTGKPTPITPTPLKQPVGGLRILPAPPLIPNAAKNLTNSTVYGVNWAARGGCECPFPSGYVRSSHVHCNVDCASERLRSLLAHSNPTPLPPTPTPTPEPTATERLSWFETRPDTAHWIAWAAIRRIAIEDESLGEEISGLSWVVDGVTAEEAGVLDDLSWLILDNPEIAETVMLYRWLGPEGNPMLDDRRALRAIRATADVDPDLGATLSRYPWIAAGPDRQESQALELVAELASPDYPKANSNRHRGNSCFSPCPVHAPAIRIPAYIPLPR